MKLQGASGTAGSALTSARRSCEVEEIKFDSDLFGFKVGRIEVDSVGVDSALNVSIVGALRQAYQGGIRLVYIYDEVVSANAREHQFQIPGAMVDNKTTYLAPLSLFNAQTVIQKSFSQVSKIHICQLPKIDGSDISEELRKLAVLSGVWSRFRVDSNIPAGAFEAMFEAWLRNSVNRSIADEVFVAKDAETGESVGFITVKLKGLTTHIGLLSVSDSHQRRGIASMLMNRAILWSFERTSWDHEAAISVVTQGSNTPACKFYESVGFSKATTQRIFHAWLPQHLDEPKMRCDNVPIPFCKQFLTGAELENVSQVLSTGLDSGGKFTTMCASYIKAELGADCDRVIMVPSGTAALEMAALLIDCAAGDEIIMPSYTFTSTANAFVLRGGVPVFVDVRKDTLNIDENLIEAAITPRTKAICCVHYGGVPCEMDTICAIAAKHNLFVVEDAAQGFQSYYKGRALGSIGHFGCFSFHFTKNVISGEGGALSVNKSSEMARRAVIMWEKGTNRYHCRTIPSPTPVNIVCCVYRYDFMAGKVDKYHWIDLGSSYIPSEISCAVLWAQLNASREILDKRVANFHFYMDRLQHLSDRGLLRIPAEPPGCGVNGHIFFIVLPSQAIRETLEKELKHVGISAFSHYVPLHSSPAGKRFGRVVSQAQDGQLPETDAVFVGLLRLPVWVGLTQAQLSSVVEIIERVLTTA
jgi:dTDP-4-amino-4,6-dideoxygalactose transaminase